MQLLFAFCTLLLEISLVRGSISVPETYAAKEYGLTADEVMHLGRTLFKSRPIHAADIASTSGNLALAQTNGESRLGTLNATKYGKCILDDATPDEDCLTRWNNTLTNGTTPYVPAPDTGKVRVYNFTISRGILAPDGVEKPVILVNGEFPGPTIEANWGDTVQVSITNNISNPEEGTIIHWHGLRQYFTVWEDGVPGVSQTPIPPNETFIYSFIADPFGSTWYHSHYSAQYSSGVIGALIIHGPSHVDYDEDFGPILLTDWYHQPYFPVLERVMGNDSTDIATAVTAQGNLINGKGSFDCSEVTDGQKCTADAGFPKFQFTSGKTYRLRLINVGSHVASIFSIDNHVLTVIAYDFTQLVPYETNYVTLAIGQRVDVLVTANGSPTDAVWMRSDGNLSCNLIEQPYGYGMIYYEDADTNHVPESTGWDISTIGQCANDNLEQTVPYIPFALPTNGISDLDIVVNFSMNATGYLVYTMNGFSFRADYNNPVLLAEYNVSSNASQELPDFPLERNVYRFPAEAESVRINLTNLTPLSHPMHIHGHASMYVLAAGNGTWDGETSVRPENPMRRDVQVVQPHGYIVIQVDLNLNPGIWPLHCHIVWHSSPGLLVNLVERPDLIPQLKIPESIHELSRRWDACSHSDIVNQIDSGV